MPRSEAKTRENPIKGNHSPKPKGPGALEGEGSYSATRDYNQHLKNDLKTRDVVKSGNKARRAIEGKEGKELREAEEKGKRGPFSKP